MGLSDWSRKSVRGAQGLAEGQGRGGDDVERTRALGEGDEQPRVGRVVDFVGDAGALAAEEEDVAGAVGEVLERLGRAGGEEQDATIRLALGGEKSAPAGMALDDGQGCVIQGCTPDRAIGKREPAGLDYVDPSPQTGAKTQRRAKVLRNVRLKKGQTHSKRSSHGMNRGNDEAKGVICHMSQVRPPRLSTAAQNSASVQIPANGLGQGRGGPFTGTSKARRASSVHAIIEG
jgi:hypothetical protein